MLDIRLFEANKGAKHNYLLVLILLNHRLTKYVEIHVSEIYFCIKSSDSGCFYP